MRKSRPIVLTDEERRFLETILSKGSHRARLMRRCQILLKADQGLANKEIAEHVRCSLTNVVGVRKRFFEGGLERALYDAPRPGAPTKFSDDQISKIIQLAQSVPPNGKKKWSASMLCKEAVSRGLVASISAGRVRAILKKNDQQPRDGAS